MVFTFILTRTFAVCALIVGAVPLAQAAPIELPATTQDIEERNCRVLGCLRVVLPNNHASTADIALLPDTADKTATDSHTIGDVLSDIDTSSSMDPRDSAAEEPGDDMAQDVDADWAEFLPEIDSLEK